MKNLLETQLADPAEDVEVGRPGFMDKFFQEVEKTKEVIRQIKATTITINELQSRLELAVGTEAEHECSDKLAKIVQTNKNCATAKRILEHMKTETGKIKESSDVRIRENLHANLLGTLVQAVRGYQTAQAN